MIIGIDDTDSEDGMCTTYLLSVLMDRLRGLGTLTGLPHLVRLNPNIRYKTRGNAALALEIDADPAMKDIIETAAVSLVEELADLECDNTNPGIVFIRESQKNDPGLIKALDEFMWRAMRDILTIYDARRLIDRHGLNHSGFKNGRGLIGALAACGAVLCGLPDHTYELIAYRRPENFGTRRKIDRESVFRADMKTYPETWDTVDLSNDTIVFAPHSPDPVLFGIRGGSISAVQQAFDMIESEPAGRTVLYRTNQGTDLHLLEAAICDIREGRSYILTGTVMDKPRTIEGGHMFFTLHGSGSIECAAFEPTKNFRRIVERLLPGDKVRVFGGVKNATLNMEKLEILETAEHVQTQNPVCPGCSKRMKSAGRNQGYRCRSCSTKSGEVEHISLERDLEPGMYEVPPCARRHISKPLIRSGIRRAFPSR